MRDTIELIALILLLVAGHQALEDRPRSAAGLARSFLGWVAFFGGIIVLTYLPRVVVWLLYLLLAMGSYYLVTWLRDLAVETVVGRGLMDMPKPPALADLALDLMACPAGVETANGRGRAGRRERRQVRRLARAFGPEAVLRAAFRQASPVVGVPGDFEARVAAERSLAEGVARAALEPGADRIAAADRRFVAQALLVYDCADVERILKRWPESLGSRKRRSASASVLADEARRSPWCATIEALGLFSDPRPIKKPTEATELPARGLGAYLASLAFPPLGYAWAGMAARGALLAGAWIALLAYALITLAEDRPVGWVYLAVWGLFQLMGMFSVHDLRAGA
jgi:hypothetical protein